MELVTCTTPIKFGLGRCGLLERMLGTPQVIQGNGMQVARVPRKTCVQTISTCTNAIAKERKEVQASLLFGTAFWAFSHEEIGCVLV